MYRTESEVTGSGLPHQGGRGRSVAYSKPLILFRTMVIFQYQSQFLSLTFRLGGQGKEIIGRLYLSIVNQGIYSAIYFFRKDPFYEEPLEKAFYYPSLPKQIDTQVLLIVIDLNMYDQKA